MAKRSGHRRKSSDHSDLPPPSIEELQRAFAIVDAEGLRVHIDQDGILVGEGHLRLRTLVPDLSIHPRAYGSEVDRAARVIARAYEASRASSQVTSMNYYGFDVEWKGVTDSGEFRLLVRDRRTRTIREMDPETEITIDAHYPSPVFDGR